MPIYNHNFLKLKKKKKKTQQKTGSRGHDYQVGKNYQSMLIDFPTVHSPLTCSTLYSLFKFSSFIPPLSISGVKSEGKKTSFASCRLFKAMSTTQCSLFPILLNLLFSHCLLFIELPAKCSTQVKCQAM